MKKLEKPIAVFGATGAQGGPVVEALFDRGRPVRAIARTPSKLQPLADRGAEIFALDLADAEALKKALTGVGGAFVHLPFLPVMEIVETQTIRRELNLPATPLDTWARSQDWETAAKIGGS